MHDLYIYEKYSNMLTPVGIVHWIDLYNIGF